MNQTNDNDFTQFEGKFDFSQAPDPTFAEILRRRMENERVAKPMQRTTVLASPPTPAPQVQRPTVVPSPSRRPIWAAVAVVLVLAVVGASAWSVRDVWTEGQYGAAPEVVLPVDASVTPGADVEMTSRLLAPIESSYESYTIVGDVLVGNDYPSGDEDALTAHKFFALDARSGELLWTHEGWYGYAVLGDNQSIYLLREEVDENEPLVEGVTVAEEPTEPQTIEGISLLALDPKTGDIQWEYELPPLEFDNDTYPHWATPILADDVIYLANWHSLIAIDVIDGSESWQTSTRLPDPGSMDGLVGIASYGGYVVMVSSDGDVLAYQPENGDVISHHHLELETYIEAMHGSDLVVASSESGTIVVWTGFGPSEPHSVTMLIDPLTGDVLSAVETDASSGINAFADDGSVAFVPIKWRQGNIIMQIFGRGGSTATSLVWFDTGTGDVRLQTEYVRVGDFFIIAVANDGQYACYSSTTFDCYDQTGTRYKVSEDPVYWTQIADGQLYYSTDDGIFVVDLP